MRVMRQALPLITPSFCFNAKEFIKQEDNHRRLHHKLNEGLKSWGMRESL